MISDVLQKELYIKDPEHELLLNNAVDRIYTNISGMFEKKSLKSSLEVSVISIASQQLYFFSQVCGIASLWELQLRLFADKIGITTTKDTTVKSRKNKNIKAVQFLDLSDLIKDIKKFSRFIKQDLKVLGDARGALVHGNFQALRQLINATLPMNRRKEHEGNVMVLTLDSNNDIRNLSEPNDAPENESIFGWLLEGSNSTLLRTTLDLFQDAIIDIRTIVSFNAYAFDECKDFFDKVVRDGQKLNDEEEKLFIKHLNEKQLDDKTFLERVYNALTI